MKSEQNALTDWLEAEREYLAQRCSNGHLTFAQILGEDTIERRAYAKWKKRNSKGWYEGVRQCAIKIEKSRAAEASEQTDDANWLDLPRHDDLENPPDFVTLRDDYWTLFDAVMKK